MSIISDANAIEDYIADILGHVDGYIWMTKNPDQYKDDEDRFSTIEDHMYEIQHCANKIRNLI